MKPLRNGLLLMTTAVGVYASAQQPDVCAAWKDVPVPQADKPSPSYAPKAGTCNGLVLYYETESPTRFQAARWCAFASIDEYRDPTFHNARAASDDPHDGPGDPVANMMLSMLYANGEGVAKDAAIAKHYACQAEDWFRPEEIVAAIDKGGRFEECESDGGSGRIVNYACINLRQAQVSNALQRAKTSANAALSPAQRELLRQLMVAEEAYRKAEAYEEPNGTSGAVQSGMSNELNMDRTWLAELQSIAAGKAPAAGTPASHLAAADKHLNELFQQNLKLAAETNSCDSCTSEEQYREAARAWLRYRESWVKFGAARWPEVQPDQWRAWLTEERNSGPNSN